MRVSKKGCLVSVLVVIGGCVVVIGARVDNEHSQRVRKFWQEYFEVTGANLEDHNYMHRPVKLPEHPCP